ncbi:MAG: XAC2610-related protein [Pyrinomonadaceae bacterium]
MKKTFVLILLFCAAAFAQEKFEIKDASKNYNARVEVAHCKEGICEGKLKVSLFKKSQSKPFQVITLGSTEFMREEAQMSNTKMMYDYQSVVFFEDYNFDGAEDLAIRDGNNGGYGGPSYQIYLFSKAAGKFVRSPSLTNLAQGGSLGMFEVDKKKRVLRTFSKDGCCWHQTEEFSVINNRPKKVFEETEDATIPNEKKVKITAKKFVGGRWRTSVKYVKREE